MYAGRSRRLGFLYVLPALLFVLVFTAWPFVQMIWMSFHSWSLIKPPKFIGLNNFSRLFEETIYPVVVAADDFGVKSVALTANGLPVQTVGHTPYEFVYTPAYEHIGDHVVLAARITDSSGQTSVVSTELDVPAITTSTPGTVGGSVPATLALSLGAPAAFGAFTPGVAKDYTAATTANVVSTAGDAALTVSDPGHLTNGSFSLPEPLQVGIAPASWTGPVSNAAVAIAFKQRVNATDALRTGRYSKTLTFTLSTTTP